MVDDSAITNIIVELPNGSLDALLDGADIDAYAPVYVSGDQKVKMMGAAVTQANAKKFLGYSMGQALTGYDTQVAVKTRFSRLIKAKSGQASMTAGMWLKYEVSTGAKQGYFIQWVPATDEADERQGMCWLGGDDEDDIEVLIF